MKKYSLVYIDDNPEITLSRYLNEEFSGDEYEIEYSEIKFNLNEDYESLISNPKVRGANIILIDSLLFENQNATASKFTGEEFKLVLKKFYPFIEVFVITQNETNSEIAKIAKYDKSYGGTPSEFYESTLPPKINKAISDIEQYLLLSDLLKNNNSWEDVLKDKIISTLKGTNDYESLKKSDIDNLVSAFKKIQEEIDD